MTGREDFLSRTLKISAIFICLLDLTYQACQPSTEFDCITTTQCVPNNLKCNYYDDCTDGSDEDPTMCSRPQVDENTALILALRDRGRSRSFLLKLFGNPNDYVWKLDNSSYDGSLPINYKERWFSTYDFFHCISVDYRQHRMYWGNNAFGIIQHGLQVYHNKSTYFFKSAMPPMEKINGITFDWVSENNYWIIDDLKMIATANQKRRWKPVIETGLVSPQDITVDPAAGYLFWSDAGNGTATIERSNLDGGNRTVLLTVSDGLVFPTKLVADATSGKLYWLDSAANSTGSVNYDGTELNVTQRDEFGQYSAMTVHKNFLFFGDGQQPKIHVYDKSTLRRISSRTLVTIADGPVVDMIMFSIETQPNVTSPCAIDNGGCSQFCFTTSPTSRVCQCSAGFLLDIDGAMCAVRPLTGSFLLIADNHQHCIYQLKPETGDIRALWTTHLISPIGVTFDHNANVAYTTCLNFSALHHIRRTSLDGRTDDFIYSASSDSKLAGIDVDSTRGLLYFADRYHGVISEMSTDGSQKRDIISDNQLSPTAVVVDPQNRQIYWTDCCIASDGTFCSKPATIQLIGADGVNRSTLISDDVHQCISALYIDFDNRQMYWASVSNNGFSTVEQANLNGTGRRLLLQEHHRRYTGLTRLDDSLYISDSKRSHVVKFNLTAGTLSVQPPSVFSKLYDVKFVANSSGLLTVSPSTTQPTVDKVVIIAAAAGGGGGLLLIIIIIVIIVCCCVKKRREKASKTAESTYAEIYDDVQNHVESNGRPNPAYGGLGGSSEKSSANDYSNVTETTSHAAICEAESGQKFQERITGYEALRTE